MKKRHSSGICTAAARFYAVYPHCGAHDCRANIRSFNATITNMREQRRHQRIRFGSPPPIRIGYNGSLGDGYIENLSLSGLMVRTRLQLDVGHNFGCDFSIFGSPRIDVVAATVSRIGDLYGARFIAGPISERGIDDAMNAALASGWASAVTMHNIGGRSVMRVAGGLSAALSNDFEYSLGKVGVDEFDFSAVTRIEAPGLELCRRAVEKHGVAIGAASECFNQAWTALAAAK